MMSHEIKEAVWHGVSIPTWLRVFDCRLPDNQPTRVSPEEMTLYAEDAAAWDLGLLSDTERYNSTPLSCNTYLDYRNCSEEAFQADLARAIDEAVSLLADYHDAVTFMKGKGLGENGGPVYYKPVALAISNFGWSILADKRIKVIRAE